MTKHPNSASTADELMKAIRARQVARGWSLKTAADGAVVCLLCEILDTLQRMEKANDETP